MRDLSQYYKGQSRILAGSLLEISHHCIMKCVRN